MREHVKVFTVGFQKDAGKDDIEKLREWKRFSSVDVTHRWGRGRGGGVPKASSRQ
jgi:hypothetical protein